MGLVGLFRVFLAMIVAADHAQIFIFGGSVLPFAGYGSAPVCAFFIMSGFYMAMVLDTKYMKMPAPDGVRAFYLNRALRIYPSYWLILCVSALLMLRDHQTSILFWTQSTEAAWNALAGFPSAIVALIASSNILIFGIDYLIVRRIMPDGNIVTSAEIGAIPAHSFMLFPPAWTLAVEMLFYLLAPIIMLRRTILIVASCVATALILGLGVPQAGSPLNLSYCIAGMATYYLYTALPDTPVVRRAGGLMTAATMLFAVAANHIPIDNSIRVNIFIAMTWLMMPFAFMASRDLRFDRWLGNASYGMYVSHFALYKFLSMVVSDQIRTTVYFPALLTAGLLLARFVERPLEKHAKNIFPNRASIGKPVSLDHGRIL